MPCGGKASLPAVPGLAAGCALLAAPAFLAPSSQGAPTRLRTAGAAVAAQSEQKVNATHGKAGISGAAGAGAVSAVAIISLARRQGRSATARRAFNPENELGVQAPVRFWDPAGFCKDGNEANFKRRRTVEIKHGRVSMLACIGFIVPEYVRFPGELSPSEGISFADVPNGLAALSKVPSLGWAQIFFFAGFIETGGLARLGLAKPNPNEPGNLGLGNLGALGLFGSIKDPKVRATKLNAEIANGRLAMFAIMGLLFQNGVTGSTGPELYGFGENSAVILVKVLFPAFAAFGILGETFRRGPGDNFKQYYNRTGYGKDGGSERI